MEAIGRSAVRHTPFWTNAVKSAVVVPLLAVAVFSSFAVLIATAVVLLAAAGRKLAVAHSRALEGPSRRRARGAKGDVDLATRGQAVAGARPFYLPSAATIATTAPIRMSQPMSREPRWPGRMRSDHDRPVPGRPIVARVPRGPTFTVAPRPPTERLAPDFDRLIRRPRPRRIEER